MNHIDEQPLNFDKNASFSANATFRVDFASPIGDSGTNKGVAKGDKKAGETDKEANQYQGLDDHSVSFKEEVPRVEKDLNLITRSAASSNVSRALGLNSVVAESYAQDPNGNPVGVSAMASGTQVMTNVVDANGMPQNTITRDFDFSRPDIQRGLYDLEAVDYLTGQIDRHGGNIFINNETGQVEGIDNDLCFGSKPLSQATTDAAIGSKATGAPPLYYHTDTAAAIEAMTPESLTKLLRDTHAPDGSCGLADEEIAQACQRLETMQASIQLARNEGRVVDHFDRKTFEASVEHQQQKAGESVRGKHAGTGNYVGRSHLELELAKQSHDRDVTRGIEPFDLTPEPGGPRPLTDYEAELQGHNQAIHDARILAKLNPSQDLMHALNEQRLIKQDISSLDHGIDQALNNKKSLQSKTVLDHKADAALKKNIAALSDCTKSNIDNPESPAITEQQAKLLRGMTGLEVEPGQRLDADQRKAIQATMSRLNANALSAARERETKNQTDLVHSTAPDLQAQKKEALARLTAANAKVNDLIEQDPRVQQAVAAKQQFVQDSKPGLAQANLERANERVASAEKALKAAREADAAAWFDNEPGKEEENQRLEGLNNQLANAEKELAAAKQDQQQAAERVQAIQSPTPRVDRMVAAPPAGQARLKDLASKLPPPPAPPGAPGSKLAGGVSSESVEDSLKKQAAGRRPAPQRTGPSLSELAQTLPPPPTPPVPEESKRNSVGANTSISWKRPTGGPKESKGLQIGAHPAPSPTPAPPSPSSPRRSF